MPKDQHLLVSQTRVTITGVPRLERVMLTSIQLGGSERSVLQW